MSGLRVVVAGAGIGGLAAALTLAPHADEITLVERRTDFGETGAGIQLSPNASRILIDLGLGSALQRVASEPERILIRDLRSGRALGSAALGRAAFERFGAPYWFVARSDLHTTLLDAVRSRGNIRLRVGRTVAAIAHADNHVTLTCRTGSGGTETMQADLLVGADGLRSTLRAALGDGREPRYSGYTAYRTTIATERLDRALPRGEGTLWLGAGRHLVHYPIAGGRMLNVIGVEARDDQVEGWSAPVAPARMAASFGAGAPELRRLVEAAESWSAWSLFDLPPRILGRGRVCLLGDAAHPALPFLAQGGALAIEDAAVLAASVADRKTDIPDAVLRYAGRRLARVRRVQTEARRNARTYHAGRLLALGRNLVMGQLGPEGMLERYSWLYGWRTGAG